MQGKFVQKFQKLMYLFDGLIFINSIWGFSHSLIAPTMKYEFHWCIFITFLIELPRFTQFCHTTICTISEDKKKSFTSAYSPPWHSFMIMNMNIHKLKLNEMLGGFEKSINGRSKMRMTAWFCNERVGTYIYNNADEPNDKINNGSEWWIFTSSHMVIFVVYRYSHPRWTEPERIHQLGCNEYCSLNDNVHETWQCNRLITSSKLKLNFPNIFCICW